MIFQVDKNTDLAARLVGDVKKIWSYWASGNEFTYYYEDRPDPDSRGSRRGTRSTLTVCCVPE